MKRITTPTPRITPTVPTQLAQVRGGDASTTPVADTYVGDKNSGPWKGQN